MITHDDKECFYGCVAVVAMICLILCLIFNFSLATAIARQSTELRIYKKLCPIEQLKEADNGSKN